MSGGRAPVGPAERRARGSGPVVALTGVSALLLVLSGSTRNGWLVLLSGLGFGVIVAALVLRPRLDPLRVTVTLPTRATAGDRVPVRVTVTNTGRRTTPATTVELAAAGLAPTSVAVPALAPGAVADAVTFTEALARVALDRVGTTVRSGAPFGILTVLARREVPVALLVRPAPAIPLARVPGGRGDGSAAVRVGPGVDVQGVREWQRGDTARHLHARATARHGRPVVLDRHDDLGAGVGIVVGGPAGHPLWEGMVAVVAATLADAARDGLRTAAATNDPALPELVGGTADDALDWCTFLGAPGPPRAADVVRAAAAIGAGGSVVVADLGWSATAPWWPECLAAAESAGVDLLALHAFTGRDDALCLHAAHAAVHDTESSGGAL